MTELKAELLDEILVVLYASEEPMTRREVATVTYIAERLLGKEATDVFDIFPDGVESDNVNLASDFLIDDGLVDVRKGLLTLTEEGRIEVEGILSHPENRWARIFYWTVSEILKLSPRTRIDLAGLIWMKSLGLETSNLRRANRVLNSLVKKVQSLGASLATPIELKTV